MKDVNVSDVSTLDRFASGMDSFSGSYTSTLRLVSSAAEEDVTSAKEIVNNMRQKLDEAKRQKDRAERALSGYISSCRSENRSPDSSVISEYKKEIEEAERRINYIRRALDDAEVLECEIRNMAHQADSLMSYAPVISNLCDETSVTTRKAANSIRQYIR